MSYTKDMTPILLKQQWTVETSKRHSIAANFFKTFNTWTFLDCLLYKLYFPLMIVAYCKFLLDYNRNCKNVNTRSCALDLRPILQTYGGFMRGILRWVSCPNTLTTVPFLR